MTDEDLNFKCLLAKPIELEGIGILHPLTINEISKLGLKTYNSYLSVLCLTANDIKNALDLEDEDFEIEPFDFILANCINLDFLTQMTDAMSCFFKESCGFSEDGYFFIGEINDCRMIHRANFNFFADILRKQNCIQKKAEEPLKVQSEAGKDMLKRLKLARKKYADKFKSGVEITDIISAMASKHGSINLLNVGELTMFQLIDQYKRINMIDEYYINIKSLMAGADPKDVKVKHWSSPMD